MRETTRLPTRLKDNEGFALAMAVFALVVLAAVVAGGYFSASLEFQIGRGMKAITSSFYSGESGINDVLENWDAVTYNLLEPDSSVALSPVMLPGGGSYTATVQRVGSEADSIKRYFYIEAVGRPPAPTRGERRQAVIARARFPRLCCDAAVTVIDDVILATGNPNADKVVGNDVGDPHPSWAAACAAIPAVNVPGIRIPDATLIDKPKKVEGTPDIVADPTLDRSTVLDLADLTYAELVGYADHIFTSPTHNITSAAPSIVNGKCNRGDPNNLGAPTNPSHPCFNYFPIIHTHGNLKLNGPGEGQGILLVGNQNDADLWMSGDFEFYGIAFVMDDLELGGISSLYGGAYVSENLDMNGSQPRVFFSSCAAERATRLSNLSRPVTLPSRAWVQLF